jgi:hypothetical protein
MFTLLQVMPCIQNGYQEFYIKIYTTSSSCVSVGCACWSYVYNFLIQFYPQCALLWIPLLRVARHNFNISHHRHAYVSFQINV